MSESYGWPTWAEGIARRSCVTHASLYNCRVPDATPSTTPSKRLQQIAAAALRVLAEQGVRGLTHRAVDKAAGLPSGSTSYYCRTRAALMTLVTSHLAELDCEDFQRHVSASGSVDLDGLLAFFASPECRVRSLARFELYLESARDPEFHASFRRHRQAFVDFTAQALVQAGTASPETRAEAMITDFEGRLFHELVFGDGVRIPPVSRNPA